MAVIDSLTAKLSFDFDDKALKAFDKGMTDAGKAIAVVAAGAATAGAAIFAFTSKIAEQNDALGKLAQIIGVTSQSLNELGFVAQLNGGSVNAMSTSLENLAKTSSEAARGMGAGVEAFGMLGVSVIGAGGGIKKADDLLLDVADSVARLNSQSQKLELLNKLGIDSSLLLTLEQGSAAIKRQRQEAEELGFVLDKDATSSAAKFNDEMLRVATVVKGISSAIGTKLMKQITPMIKAFLEWFKANKEIIKQNLNAFFEKLTKVIHALFNTGARVVGVINRIVEVFGGWKVAIGAVAIAMTALNARVLLLPALILAAGAAIFLLIEDMIAFADGADSQIGALAKEFKAVEVLARGLVDIFRMVTDGWKLIFTDGEKAFEGLKTIIKDIGKTIADYIMDPINKVIEAFSGFKKKTSDLAGETSDFISDGFESVSNFFMGNENTQAVSVPANSTSSTNTNNIVINIEGGNVEQVKQAVSEALGAEFKTTELNMSTPTRF